MGTLTPSGQRRSKRVACLCALVFAATVLGAGSANAADTPQHRDGDGNLSNSITSTSIGANCVSGEEAGCYTVLATPLIDPVVGTATAATLLAGLAYRARRSPTAGRGRTR